VELQRYYQRLENEEQRRKKVKPKAKGFLKSLLSRG
jgi:hypothetical protein